VFFGYADWTRLIYRWLFRGSGSVVLVLWFWFCGTIAKLRQLGSKVLLETLSHHQDGDAGCVSSLNQTWSPSDSVL